MINYFLRRRNRPPRPRRAIVIGSGTTGPAAETVTVAVSSTVAQSLAKRSSKSRDESLKLWYAYNRIMYREFKKKPFSILNFDDDEMVLDEKIIRVADKMGLVHGGGDEKFYTADLRHNDGADGPPLPWKVRHLYSKLKKFGL